MLNNDNQMISGSKNEVPSIFTLIKTGEFETIDKLIDENKVNVNECDSIGNDVVTRLLKSRQYELVLKLMKKRNWDVNHQNVEGNTFGHILALDNSVSAFKVVVQLTKKKNYIPNIKNNNGETVLDRAINSNYIYTVFKILEDKRFNNIDVLSFKKLWNACIRNTYYGKYSKLNNLEVIIENLEKKELLPSMKAVIDQIVDNMDSIKNEILKDNSIMLDKFLNNSLELVEA